MNKSELVAKLAETSGLPKNQADKALSAMLGAITETLKNGEPVSLIGFGTFQVKARAPRTGRNPRTGEAVELPASNVPSFKAGKALKDALEG